MTTVMIALCYCHIKNLFKYLNLLKIRHNRNITFKQHRGKTTLIYIFTLLVNQSSDIELNPGPSTLHYPCGYCKYEVTWNQKGILCDECEQWYHTSCQGIGESTYDKLSDSRHVWICLRCGLPNYSSCLVESSKLFV